MSQTKIPAQIVHYRATDASDLESMAARFRSLTDLYDIAYERLYVERVGQEFSVKPGRSGGEIQHIKLREGQTPATLLRASPISVKVSLDGAVFTIEYMSQATFSDTYRKQLQGELKVTIPGGTPDEQLPKLITGSPNGIEARIGASTCSVAFTKNSSG